MPQKRLTKKIRNSGTKNDAQNRITQGLPLQATAEVFQ